MSNETEIVRTLQVEGNTIHVHIHLTEEEVRRLLLPHIVDALANEVRRYGVQTYSSPNTTASGFKLQRNGVKTNLHCGQ